MITTHHGRDGRADGTSETLTSRVDRVVLGAIRATPTSCVVGAESVRAEGYVAAAGPRGSRS